MKEIPILFSTPMVQAILEGRKSQTRRLIDVPDLKAAPDRFRFIGDSTDRDFARPAIKFDDRVWYEWQLTNSNHASWTERCRWKRGDVLWVRETWRPDLAGHDVNDYIEKIRFAADGTSLPFKWVKDYNDYRNRPGIHMNKEYARIWLKVESVRVERLQDISQEDAKSEGIEPVNTNADTCPEYRDYMGNELRRIGEIKPWGLTAFGSFKSLWEKINGADSWLANPWVWVVTFSVLSTTGKPSPLT